MFVLFCFHFISLVVLFNFIVFYELIDCLSLDFHVIFLEAIYF